MTKTWSDLNFPPEVQALAPPAPVNARPGAELFARESEAFQLRALGPGKLALLKAGRIDVEDLVQHTSHPRWGLGTQEASIAQALANHDQQKPWLRFDPPPVPPGSMTVIPNREGAIRSARSMLAQGPGWAYKGVALRVMQRFGVLLSLSDVRGLWNQLRRSA